jgi:hypothetical protein
MSEEEVKSKKKTKHVVEDTQRPPSERKHRDIVLPSGERITRWQAKKISKKKDESE